MAMSWVHGPTGIRRSSALVAVSSTTTCSAPCSRMYSSLPPAPETIAAAPVIPESVAALRPARSYATTSLRLPPCETYT
jgi:hypothetical protein